MSFPGRGMSFQTKTCHFRTTTYNFQIRTSHFHIASCFIAPTNKHRPTFIALSSASRIICPLHLADSSLLRHHEWKHAKQIITDRETRKKRELDLEKLNPTAKQNETNKHKTQHMFSPKCTVDHRKRLFW